MRMERQKYLGVAPYERSSKRQGHAGLKAARQAVFGGVPWQRCQFHLQQNAQAYVPRKEMQAEVAADIRTIFNAPDRTTVVSIFPNEAACLRLISAILVETDEAWQTNKKYLSFPPSTTSS
jgi:transposase-like protein